MLTLFTLRRIRRQVVLPLNNLVAASERIERGEFATPAPDTALPNELGQLSRAFNHMSGELATLYRSLEASVAEKRGICMTPTSSSTCCSSALRR